MANEHLESVLQHIRKLVTAQAEEPLPDLDLLERFVRDRDEAAFAALVRRHGPMVLGVCRRVLLKKENEDLEKLLQRTRTETERLRKEIQRLKQDRSKPKDE
jgi:hypothetical protein